MRASNSIRYAGFILLLACAASAGAQQATPDPRQSRERELLRRQADQISTLEQERGKLASEKIALDAELKKARAQAAAAGRNRAQTERIAELEQQLVQANEAREQQRVALEEAKRVTEEQRSQLAQLRAQVNATAEHATKLDVGLNERTQQLQICSGNNDKLVRYNRDILDKLSDGRCTPSSSLQWDPVLQLGRVRYESQLEAYRDKVSGERFVPNE